MTLVSLELSALLNIYSVFGFEMFEEKHFLRCGYFLVPHYYKI